MAETLRSELTEERAARAAAAVAAEDAKVRIVEQTAEMVYLRGEVSAVLPGPRLQCEREDETLI